MGKSSDVPESTTQTVTNTTTLPPEVQRILAMATPYLEQGLKNYKPYAGDRVANLTPDQLAANQAFRLASGDVAALNADSNAAYKQGLSFLTDPMQNPAMQAAIDAAIRPIIEQFQSTVLPGIRTSAVGSGQYGGSRQDLTNRLASQAFMREVGDTSGQITYDVFNRGLTAGLQSLALGPSVAQMNQVPGQMLSEVGGVVQGQEQAEKDAQIASYYEKILGPYALASNAIGVANGIPGGSATSTNTADTGVRSPNTFQKLASGAATGTAIAGPWGGVAGAVLSLFG